MGCPTLDDRIKHVSEWEKIVVHVEEPRRTYVQVAASDGVPHAGRRIDHVFRWEKKFFHLEEAHRTLLRIMAHDGVPHVGRPAVLVFLRQEPFLPGACTATYDRKKQCPRA